MINPFITKLTHLGLIKVSGPDSKKFLQGQLTCDLNEIEPGISSLGAHCNPQGRMISLFRIFQLDDDYFLQMPRPLLPVAITALKKYAVFFKTKLEDVSSSQSQFCYCGDNPLPNAIKIPSSQLRCLLFNLPEASHTETIQSEGWWKSIDFADKIPELYPETSEKFLPHEINLPQLKGVSFKKGCYTGQEIIARMEYRGKIKKSLQLITQELQNPPMRGADLSLENDSLSTIVDFYKINDSFYQLLVLT